MSTYAGESDISGFSASEDSDVELVSVGKTTRASDVVDVFETPKRGKERQRHDSLDDFVVDVEDVLDDLGGNQKLATLTDKEVKDKVKLIRQSATAKYSGLKQLLDCAHQMGSVTGERKKERMIKKEEAQEKERKERRIEEVSAFVVSFRIVVRFVWILMWFFHVVIQIHGMVSGGDECLAAYVVVLACMLFRIAVEQVNVLDGLVCEVHAIRNYLGMNDGTTGLREMMCELLEPVRGIDKQEGHGDVGEEHSVSVLS